VSMQVVARSTVPFHYPDAELFENVLATLSSRFAALCADELSSALVQALTQVCRALRVDRSTLVEFMEDGGVRATHSGSGPDIDETQWDSDPAGSAWMMNQLRSGVPVVVSRLDDLPADAPSDREYARRSGLTSTLALPISIGGRCSSGLVLGSVQRYRDWSPLRSRARLLVELLGSALQRCRQEAALRTSLAEVERLNRRLVNDSACLKDKIKTFHDFDEIVGESTAMRDALERLSQVAPLNASVLLLGETGTGKELFARAVHDRSRRRARALVRVNCAALPPSLIESELFGHEKGAFTGAVGLQLGRFEMADGGTIFLDEIGDLPLDMQGKLLRVLQEGEFERVGSSRTRRADVRVIAATHHDLETAVAEGEFRADLYYRLSVFPIHIPSLRDRREDIPSLVWFFIHNHQRELGRRITKVPNHVLTALGEHDWPGNVRELQNAIERALIRSTGDALQLDGTFGEKPRGRVAPTSTLDDVQRWHIEQTLQQCGWRINGIGNAAERLGMHPNTLRSRMKKLGVVSRRLQRPSEPLRLPMPPDAGPAGHRHPRLCP
jgi:formate hydrogenlyase transcriptional activator